MLKLISIGDSVARGTYRLHSRFARVINYESGGRLLRIGAPVEGEGPLNALFADFSPAQFADTLTISSKDMTAAGASYPLEGAAVYSSKFAPGVSDSLLAVKAAPHCADAVSAQAGPESFASFLAIERGGAQGEGLASEFSRVANGGLALLREGRCGEGARRLVSLGGASADFLAGFLYGLGVLEKARGKNFNNSRQAIFAACCGTDILSRAPLECARDARIPARLRGLFDAMSRGGPGAEKKGLEEIRAAGRADMAAGFIFALGSPYGK